MDLLTQEETAKWLGIATETLRTWRQRKQGPAYVKVGGSTRYRMDDVKAYLEANRVDPTKKANEAES